MDKITQCYVCRSSDIEQSQFLDWDDSKEEELERDGYLCNNCLCFHYEENDRIVCIINSAELVESNDNVEQWLPQVN